MQKKNVALLWRQRREYGDEESGEWAGALMSALSARLTGTRALLKRGLLVAAAWEGRKEKEWVSRRGARQNSERKA